MPLTLLPAPRIQKAIYTSDSYDGKTLQHYVDNHTLKAFLC